MAQEIPMSAWAQHCTRGYGSKILCFPLEKYDEQDKVYLSRYLRACLAKVAQKRPDFTDTFHTVPRRSNPSHSFTHSSTGQGTQPHIAGLKETIRRRPLHGEIYSEWQKLDDHFPSFEELRKLEFPAHVFMGRLTSLEISPLGEDRGIMVKGLFIKGGLLLGVHVSHQLTDGDGSRMFLEYFAAETRSDSSPLNFPDDPALNIPRRFLDLPKHDQVTPDPRTDQAVQSLVEDCPAWTIANTLTFPKNEQATGSAAPTPEDEMIGGHIVVFPVERLRKIQFWTRDFGIEYKLPGAENISTFTALTAILWTHITIARNGGRQLPVNRSMWLRIMVNWRKRVSSGTTPLVDEDEALRVIGEDEDGHPVFAYEDEDALEDEYQAKFQAEHQDEDEAMADSDPRTVPWEPFVAPHFGNMTVCAECIRCGQYGDYFHRKKELAHHHQVASSEITGRGEVFHFDAYAKDLGVRLVSLNHLARIASYIAHEVGQVNAWFMVPRLSIAARGLVNSVDGPNRPVVPVPPGKRSQEEEVLADAQDIMPKEGFDRHNNPGHMTINTWRHFGADIGWWFPPSGRWKIQPNPEEVTWTDMLAKRYGSVKPEKIRWAGMDWAEGDMLVYPGRKDSEEMEVLLQLKEKDKKWLMDNKVFESFGARWILSETKNKGKEEERHG